MFLYFYKKNIIKNMILQMFPIATFYFGHFLKILCNRDYGTYSIMNYAIKCQNKYQVY